jgi:glycolate oxidase
MINDTDEDYAKAHRAVEEVFTETIRLGGTLSGEHGIGTAKAPYIAMELAPEVIETMRGIKRLFDPNNVLNPGKIFIDH